MKKLLLLLLFAGLLNTGSVFGWGREGHETIAKIAERNLTKKAKKRIEKYLGGHSIVYFAKWMDEYRHTPEYKFTNNWHTVPVNAGLRYEDSMLATGGNAIYGLEQAIENLKNYRSLTDSAVEVNLKYIIHLVGDMHCPAHIKYTTHDTKYDVLFEDKYHKPHKFPIHSVWDNEIITTTRIWSVSEWADELDRLPKAERQAVAAGTPRDWLHDNAVVCEAQFEWAKRPAAGTGFPERGLAADRAPDPQCRIPSCPCAERTVRIAPPAPKPRCRAPKRGIAVSGREKRFARTE